MGKTNNSKSKQRPRRQQPRKDSSSKRVNYDNARVSKIEKDIERDASKPNANDISWYSKNPQLLQAAAKIPMNTIAGTPVWSESSQTPPGVMSLPWTPAFGDADCIALNQAFDSMFSFIVHANSRNYNAESPDYAMVIFAGANVFSMIASMIRAYGTVRYYAEETSYAPDAILNAMGFIPSDVRANRGKMWYDINNLIDQTQQIWIPDTMPFVDRWFWLNSNYFTDSENVSNGQIYLYVQNQYFIYSETSLTTGSSLLPVSASGAIDPADFDFSGSSADHFHPADQQYTWDQWLNVAQSMITALTQSNDRGMIYGNIRAAYGASRIKALGSIDSEYKLAPAFNREVLTQIENYIPTNAYTKGLFQYSPSENIGSRLGVLWQTLNVGTSSFPAMKEFALNFHFPEQPTPEQIIIATRMTCPGYKRVTDTFGANIAGLTSTSPVTPSKMSFNVPACVATELAHPIHMFRMERGTGSDQSVEGLVRTSPTLVYLHSGSQAISLDYLDIMAFDWHPFIYELQGAYTASSQQDTRSVLTAYGDFDNYTVVDTNTLKKLHNVAVYSEFGAYDNATSLGVRKE